jgi:hypothetical protein
MFYTIDSAFLNNNDVYFDLLVTVNLLCIFNQICKHRKNVFS